MNEQLKKELQENLDTLITALSRFDQQAFNQPPASGGWTAGQIAEHLLVIERRTIKVLSGKTETPAPDRRPDAQVEAIQARLTDRINKIDAPLPLVPTDTPKEQQGLIDELVAARKEIIQLVGNQDMDLLLPEIPHRLFGVLSGTEWVKFTILHTERHIAQLKEIA